MALSAPSLRREYQSIPIHEAAFESTALLREDDDSGKDEGASPSTDTSSDIPPSPTSAFLEKLTSKSTRSVSLRFLQAFVVADTLLCTRLLSRQVLLWAVLALLGLAVLIAIVQTSKGERDMLELKMESAWGDTQNNPLVPPSATPAHGHEHSSVETAFPDFHEQCHIYYSTVRPMDHK